MEKRKIITGVLSGVLIGGLLFTSGGLVIADDETGSQSSSQPAVHGPQFPGKGGGGGFCQGLPPAAIEQLVANAVISQEQADKILALAKANAEEQKAKAEEFKNMTQEERQALRDQQKAERPAPLKELLDNGTLTQEQADAVREAIQPPNHRGEDRGGRLKS